MQKIKIIGTAFGQDGYSAHTRQLAMAISKYANVQLDVPLPTNWEQVMPDEYKKLINNNYTWEESIAIGIALPHQWETILSQGPKKFIGFLVWEAHTLPKCWIEICNDSRVNQIWVPSEFTRQCAIRSGVNAQKIFIVPHGVDATKFFPKNEKITDTNNPFNILFCKGWDFNKGYSDRGGFPLLLKAYSVAFNKDDNVILTAKFNSAYNDGRTSLDQALQKLGINLTQCPPCRFITQNIPFKELVNIYNLADISVVPTRSEAFGLTMLESMSSGVPCVTSNYGGQTDFISESNGWIIPTSMIPCNDGYLYEGLEWSEIEVTKLAELLKHLYLHREEILPKAKQALIDSQNWSWDASAKKAIKVLEELK